MTNLFEFERNNLTIHTPICVVQTKITVKRTYLNDESFVDTTLTDKAQMYQTSHKNCLSLKSFHWDRILEKNY